MDEIAVIELTAAPVISLVERQDAPLPAACEAAWEKAVQGNPALFDGQILSLESAPGKEMSASFVSYKRYLTSKGNIRPVAVVGVTRFRDAVLIGKRAATLSVRPGMYEPVPAGSLDPSCLREDRVDLEVALKQELLEEAGIVESNIRSIAWRAIVQDRQDDIYDIVADVQVFAKKFTFGAGEHDEIFWLDLKLAPRFLEESGKRCLPLLRYILQNTSVAS